MILSEFDYRKPGTLEEASEILRNNKNSLILAGGTDLLVKMRKGSHRPDVVVDIKNIDSIRGIHWEEGGLFIGANTTITGINRSREVAEFFPALHQASGVFGCFDVRNRATIGGNLCNASPGCECGGPCVVYEAQVKIFSGKNEKIFSIADFFTGPGRTCLREGEILAGVLLPKPPENSLSAYRRTARVKGQDLATCAVTLMALDPREPPVRSVRVGLSAVLKTPARSKELEEILSGKKIDEKVILKAQNWLRNNIHPRASSLRGTPDYKKEVMGGMLEILLRKLNLVG